jgi:hypothetical protein
VARRNPRAPRPQRPSPRHDVVPPLAVRRRRGPRPPDHVVARLVAALEQDSRAAEQHHDAAGDPPPRPGRAWARALREAPAAIVRAARRGVMGALAGVGGAAQRAAVAVVDVIRSAPDVVGGSLARAAIRIAEWVMQSHARAVEALSRAAGALWYIWTTMADDRVRPLHVELEGTRQRWDAPPLAGLPDFHGHPGDAAGPCRCQAWPVILQPIALARQRRA